MEKAGDDAARTSLRTHAEVRLIRQYNKVSRSVSKLNSEAIADHLPTQLIEADRCRPTGVMRDLNLSVLELEKENWQGDAGRSAAASRRTEGGSGKVTAAV